VFLGGCGPAVRRHGVFVGDAFGENTPLAQDRLTDVEDGSLARGQPPVVRRTLPSCQGGAISACKGQRDGGGGEVVLTAWTWRQGLQNGRECTFFLTRLCYRRMIAATAGGAALAGLALVAVVASGGNMVRKTDMEPQHLVVSSLCTMQDAMKHATKHAAIS
jgi:hypothetical protein